MCIGITGHRPNRLYIGEARARVRLTEVLTALRDAAQANDPATPLVATSALAEGADRIFAEAALELGFQLHALLPFASADYETTFANANTTSAYAALLKQAENVREMPGSLSDSKAAYEASGQAIVDQCDALVAVWDGKPAIGRGGTPEIIEYALAQGLPVLWVNAATDHDPMLLTEGEGTAHGYIDTIVAGARPPAAPDYEAMIVAAAKR